MLSRPLTLYHFTDPTNLPSIRERGLLPASLGVVNRPREKAVWLTSCPDELPADFHQTLMLTVQLDQFDRRLCSDPEEELPPQPGWFIYRGVIPPDKITFP
jgi:hypothetical protein